MALTLSRVDRTPRTYVLADVMETVPAGVESVQVALLPPRSGPTAATVWTTVTYASGSFDVLWVGPDADATGGLVVPASAQAWVKVTDAPLVEAEKLERITVLGGGANLAAPLGVPVVSVNGKQGSAVVLSAADVGAPTTTDLSTGLATKVNSSTYTAGLAGKQDVATLAADAAAHVADGSALDVALRAALVPRVRPVTNLAFRPGYWNRNPGDTTSSGYAVIGIDTTLDMPYCLDSGNGQVKLCTGVDAQNRPNAWSNNKTIPTGTQWYNATKILTFKGKLYLLTVQDSTNLPAIYSATPAAGNTALTWDAAPLIVGTAGSVVRPVCFSADANYLYFADYGDPSGGPRLFRSADGTTWTTLQTFAGVRHVHAVKPDPYNPGHVWIAMGDGVTQQNRSSTDSGATFAGLPAVNGDEVQVTDFGFSPTDVWATDDTAYLTAVTFDRTTKAWSGACASFHGLTPHPAPRTGQGTFYDGATTNASTTLTSASAAFVSSVILFDPTDVGAKIRGAGIPAGTTIASVTNATTVVLSQAATATATAVTFTIERRAQTFAPAVFYGEVDPAEGIFYMTTQQSSKFPEGALFAVMGKGTHPVLLDYGGIGSSAVYLWRDRVFYGPFNRRALELI